MKTLKITLICFLANTVVYAVENKEMGKTLICDSYHRLDYKKYPNAAGLPEPLYAIEYDSRIQYEVDGYSFLKIDLESIKNKSKYRSEGEPSQIATLKSPYGDVLIDISFTPSYYLINNEFARMDIEIGHVKKNRKTSNFTGIQRMKKFIFGDDYYSKSRTRVNMIKNTKLDIALYSSHEGLEQIVLRCKVE